MSDNDRVYEIETSLSKEEIECIVNVTLEWIKREMNNI